MKKSFIWSLCILLLIVVSNKSWCKEFNKMQVKTVSKNLIVANKGKIQGVHVDEVYTINREGQTIGKAKVLLIEDNLCGLKILQLQPGFYVRLGDILIKNSTDSSNKNKRGYIYRPPKPDYCIRFLQHDKILTGV